MEVVRFGVGHRRPEGPAGTTGLTGVVVHADGRGSIAEFAFARSAHIAPHSNPNTTWFVVIEGGGWVAVGEERSRVNAGEAVLWPADVLHAAWTEHSEMRAIVVEFAADDETGRAVLEGVARPALASSTRDAPAIGGLAARDRPREPTAREGEPY
ncbi:MAG: cupin domain-containing protein [Chloroflexi bacterium]|nr:cupin domain-containing protein [Chloroflexota bacterium]